MPPATVIIPQGASLSVFCKGSGSINWYKEGTLIQMGGVQEECGCTNSIVGYSQGQFRINLTFINFQAANVGTYSCLRPMGIGRLVQCDFDAILAGNV